MSYRNLNMQGPLSSQNVPQSSYVYWLLGDIRQITEFTMHIFLKSRPHFLFFLFMFAYPNSILAVLQVRVLQVLVLSTSFKLYYSKKLIETYPILVGHNFDLNNGENAFISVEAHSSLNYSSICKNHERVMFHFSHIRFFYVQL